jgi:hypothetical protein
VLAVIASWRKLTAPLADIQHPVDAAHIYILRQSTGRARGVATASVIVDRSLGEEGGIITQPVRRPLFARHTSSEGAETGLFRIGPKPLVVLAKQIESGADHRNIRWRFAYLDRPGCVLAPRPAAQPKRIAVVETPVARCVRAPRADRQARGAFFVRYVPRGGSSSAPFTQECPMHAHEKRQLAQSAAVVVGVDAGKFHHALVVRPRGGADSKPLQVATTRPGFEHAVRFIRQQIAPSGRARSSLASSSPGATASPSPTSCGAPTSGSRSSASCQRTPSGGRRSRTGSRSRPTPRTPSASATSPPRGTSSRSRSSPCSDARAAITSSGRPTSG